MKISKYPTKSSSGRVRLPQQRSPTNNINFYFPFVLLGTSMTNRKSLFSTPANLNTSTLYSTRGENFHNIFQIIRPEQSERCWFQLFNKIERIQSMLREERAGSYCHSISFRPMNQSSVVSLPANVILRKYCAELGRTLRSSLLVGDWFARQFIVEWTKGIWKPFTQNTHRLGFSNIEEFYRFRKLNYELLTLFFCFLVNPWPT